MKLTFLRLFSLALIISSISSCKSNLTIWASKTDPNELKKYKTYAWVAPGDSALSTRRDDKLYAGLIESSANKELQKMGMKLDNKNPDAVFMFDTKIDEKVVTRKAAETGYNAYGYGGYAYGYNGAGYYNGAYNPMRGLETASMLVDQGTLSYLMYDRQTAKLVWQGTAKKDLSKKTNIESTIKRAANFIFAKLPINVK
ncbi:DUF4136 domain-containing protein [Chryseolinea sp. T2]|uniref:DUF4136 domain-containing protein n=1 Tax=Chryseolinea sp. T2 TaxID=3129255 RepID=UPI003077DC8C